MGCGNSLKQINSSRASMKERRTMPATSWGSFKQQWNWGSRTRNWERAFAHTCRGSSSSGKHGWMTRGRYFVFFELLSDLSDDLSEDLSGDFSPDFSDDFSDDFSEEAGAAAAAL